MMPMRRTRRSACEYVMTGAAASAPPSPSTRRLLTGMASSPSGSSPGKPQPVSMALGTLVAVVPAAGLAGRRRLHRRLDGDRRIRLRERDGDGREQDEGRQEQREEQQMFRDAGDWRHEEIGFAHGASRSRGWR